MNDLTNIEEQERAYTPDEELAIEQLRELFGGMSEHFHALRTKKINGRFHGHVAGMLLFDYINQCCRSANKERDGLMMFGKTKTVDGVEKAPEDMKPTESAFWAAFRMSFAFQISRIMKADTTPCKHCVETHMGHLCDSRGMFRLLIRDMVETMYTALDHYEKENPIC